MKGVSVECAASTGRLATARGCARAGALARREHYITPSYFTCAAHSCPTPSVVARCGQHAARCGQHAASGTELISMLAARGGGRGLGRGAGGVYQLASATR